MNEASTPDQQMPEHDVVTTIPATDVPEDQNDTEVPEGPQTLVLKLDKNTVRALRDTFLAIGDGKQVTIITTD